MNLFFAELGRRSKAKIPPPAPEVWPRENPASGAMAERFAKELAEVHAEFMRDVVPRDFSNSLPTIRLAKLATVPSVWDPDKGDGVELRVRVDGPRKTMACPTVLPRFP